MPRKKTKDLTLAADVAVNENPAKCHGIAYSGGPVTQGWSDVPIYIDLAGIEFADQVPLMMDHEYRVSERLGEVQCSVVDNQLILDGEITAVSDKAQRVI